MEHVERRHFPDTFVYTCPHCAEALGKRAALAVHKHRCNKKQQQIGRMTQKAAGRGQEEEEGPEDDYFEEEEQEEEEQEEEEQEEEEQEEEGRRNSASTEYLSNFLGR